MKVSTVLDHIDSGHMALPEFQRGYVWNRDQVRGLMDSMYRRHPVGSLLVWATESKGAEYRGDAPIAAGIVKLLLDGQQRITSLYGIIRGRPPEFFDGNVNALTGLHFNIVTEEFSYYQPVKMQGDKAWIDVTALMQAGNDGIGALVTELAADPERSANMATYLGRLNQLLGIKDIEFHVEEVTGVDKTVDVVVDIFNMVNSGGTKLSKGDLALAKICAEWPEGRDMMKRVLDRWQEAGYHFKLDWLLRSVNTISTGEALFAHLDGLEIETIQESLRLSERHIDKLLNLIGSRLGLDHDRVFFGRYAMPVMAYYLDKRGGSLDSAAERDQLLYWYVNCAMWGRYSGSTESRLNQDLGVLVQSDLDLRSLVDALRIWRGGSLRIVPDNFSGYGRGARFYPVLYMLSRIRGARDWGLGTELKQNMLGAMSSLERHHIFPKALMKRHGYAQSQRNAVANFCFLTKETNLEISDRAPAEYFPEIAAAYPGALESQWIPMDTGLWEVDRYPEFLAARRELLAEASNEILAELGHGLHDEAGLHEATVSSHAVVVGGGIETDAEEEVLNEVNEWIVSQGLPEGEFLYELVDPETGDPQYCLDLAWPDGLQEGLSQPVALLLNEESELILAAGHRGFNCYTSVEEFRGYVSAEILGTQIDEPVGAAH